MSDSAESSSSDKALPSGCLGDGTASAASSSPSRPAAGFLLHEMGFLLHEELLTRQKDVQRLGCSASRAVRAAVCACPSIMWTACGNQTASERTLATVTEAVQNFSLRRAYSAHAPDRLLRCASFWLRLRAVTSCSCRRLPWLLLLL